MTVAIGRNEPCPCGSGKKHKNCCAGKTPWTETRIAGIPAPVLLALLAGIVAVTALVSIMAKRDQSAVTTSAGSLPLASAPSGATPTPWSYDSTTNRHWDPAHNHWHDGPPPAGAQSGAVSPTLGTTGPAGSAGATPAPYQYDPATNKHWDPAHGHWHDGPPPTTPTR